MEVMEEAPFDKPLYIHASLVEDPDEGLTEEEKAAIVRYQLQQPQSRLKLTVYRRIADYYGSWTSD